MTLPGQGSSAPITLGRDCPATTVPRGDLVVLPEGSKVQVLQQLGGSITVRTELGSMLRIDGEHSDALGLEPAERNVSIVGRRKFSLDLVDEQLQTVYDPEIPVSIVELGLVYRRDEVLQPDGTRLVEIDLSMTSPGCGMGDVLRADADRVVRALPGVDDVKVELVWDPPWTMDRMSDEAKLQLGML